MRVKKYRIIVSLATIIFLIPLSESAQNPVYQNYGVKEGLPSEVVYYALQDNKGFMWFATDAGVSRFDGIHFRNFTVKDGLADNNIIGLYEDKVSRLWFLSFNGRLSYYRNDSIFNESNDPLLRSVSPAGAIENVTPRTNGNFWISYNSGTILEISLAGEHNEIKMGYRYKGYDNWSFVHEVSDHEYWIFNRYNCSKFVNGIKDSLVLPDFRTDSIHFFFMKCVTPKESFFNNHNGICCLNDDHLSLLIPREKIPHYNELEGLGVDINHGVWLFTKGHETFYWKKTKHGYEYSGSFFQGTHIGTVALDNENNYWFCSIGDGVFKISANSVLTRVYRDSYASANRISCIKLNRAGNLCYGNSRGNVYYLRDDSTEKYSLQPFPLEIRSLIFNEEDDCFAATQRGLFVRKKNLDINTFVLHPLEAYKGRPIENFTAIKFDYNGDLLLATGIGIFRISDFGKAGEKISRLIPDNTSRSYCLYLDFDNNIWFENFNYLFNFDGQHVNNFKQFAPEFKPEVTDINQLPDSTIVIGTYGNGIIFLKNAKITGRLNSSNGLVSDLCTRIFIQNDTIYAATRNGFSIFQCSYQQISGLHSITTDDGILSNDINDISVNESNIFLATSEGVCVVNKKITEVKSNPPPIYITHVQIGDSILKSLKDITLAYNSKLEINWIALTYQQPEKISYEYRLNPQQNWISTNNSSIFLSSLLPSSYHFQVRARKINSDWSMPVDLAIKVTPLFYQQWWFRVLVALTIAVSIFLLSRIYLNRRYQKQLILLKQERILADERNRIASDMHDDLGADLSNLLMLARMTKRSKQFGNEEQRHLETMETSISNTISKVDEIIWALNPSNDSLSDLVRFLKEYIYVFKERSKIDFSLKSPELIPEKKLSSRFRRNIVLVFKEAMNNIIQHSQATKVEVKIGLENNYLIVSIHDNGIGIIGSEKETRGNGMFNMERRIKELNGAFEIIPEAGVKMQLQVPLENA
ncbi:MAG TPA: two-component regulator propeller domain-containing protein [Chitinophagales bacterium]|nr:two-component regulator propeller domain-containing protein [Chitinophagales bacterium]